jgi:hypothetical protein
MGQVVAFQSLAEARGLHTEIAQDDSKALEHWEQGNHEPSMDTPEEEEAYVDRVWPVVRFLNGRTLLLTPGMRSSAPGLVVLICDFSGVRGCECFWQNGGSSRSGRYRYFCDIAAFSRSIPRYH